ncbi:MAG: hypothetical protein PHR21_03095 [Oscillospiraceae bacterium]|nr:hypothetical protein [Oscillospiraceae bacterium]MDD4367399.1 hypothetical protein [Oscillospiraceae bacterium]
MKAGIFELVLLLILLFWAVAALKEWRRGGGQAEENLLGNRWPGCLRFGQITFISLLLGGEWLLAVYARQVSKSPVSPGLRLTGAFFVSGLIIMALFDGLFLRLPNRLLFRLGCGGLLLQPDHNTTGKVISLLLLLLTAVILEQPDLKLTDHGGLAAEQQPSRQKSRLRRSSLGGGDLKLLAILPVFGGVRTAADLLLRTCLFLLAGFMLQALMPDHGQEQPGLPLGPFCLAAALTGGF